MQVAYLVFQVAQAAADTVDVFLQAANLLMQVAYLVCQGAKVAVDAVDILLQVGDLVADFLETFRAVVGGGHNSLLIYLTAGCPGRLELPQEP